MDSLKSAARLLTDKLARVTARKNNVTKKLYADLLKH